MKVTSGSPELNRTASSESDPERIIYGGTFDPPHLGHAALTQKIMRRFPSASLDVIVAAAPAGAYGQHKRSTASFEDRLAMCQLTFRGERVRVNPIESRLEQPNYSWRTLEALKREAPGTARWAWLMGQDQFESFPGWNKAEDLLDEMDIVIVDRDGFEDWSHTEARFARDFFPLEKNAAGYWNWLGKKGRVYRIPGDTSPAASRILRQGIAGHEAWLSPEVLAYIEKKKLYKADEG